MIKLNYVRILARLWFGTMLLLGLTICVMSFTAHAAKDDGKTPPTQPGLAGTPPGNPRSGTPLSGDSIASDEPDTFDYNQEIRNRVQSRGGPYIIGRDDEARLIDDKLMTSDNHTVVVQSESGAGRTGVVEEFVRQNQIQNPHDKVIRLNLRNLDLKSDVEAVQSFKKILVDLERQNIEMKGQSRTILFVENISGLLKGELLQPIMSLREFFARDGNLYVILEGDPATVKTQILEGKYAKLQTSLEILDVKPPLYDAVLARLMNDKVTLERGGITVSQSALENAARIAIRYRRNQAFKFAYQLIESAVRQIEGDRRLGTNTKDRLTAELNQLTKIRTSIEADLKAETDSAEKESLQKRLAQLNKDILSKTADSELLSLPTDTRSKLAALEIEVRNLESELEESRRQNKPQGWTDRFFGTNPKPEVNRALREVSVIDKELAEKNAAKTNLELDLTQSEDTGGRPVTRVSGKQIIERASARLKLPAQRLAANFDEGVHRIQDIKKVIYGQDHIIDALESKLLIAATHLQEGRTIEPGEGQDVLRGLVHDAERPLGSFFFAGPTGVGKTQTAIELEKILGYELIRLDMSELQQEHMLAKWIGSPPGYVGYGSPGELIARIQANPEAIVLFDEIEKAHPKVLDVLLQILDAGRLSPAGGGAAVDFRKSIIIMTSNLAQKLGSWSNKELVEFLKKTGGMSELDIERLTKYDPIRLRREAYRVYVKDPDIARAEYRAPMRPELIERIDELMMFNKLTDEDAVRIAQKTVSNLVNRMKELYKITIKFSPDAIVELMSNFNSDGGGRSMRRAFDELFRAPLARIVSDKSLVPGDTLLISVDEGRSLELIRTNAKMVAKAEESTTSAKPEVTEMKDRLLSRNKAKGPMREARAATAELVRKVFNKDWFVSERAFRAIKRGK